MGGNVTSKTKRDSSLQIETLRSRLTEAEEALQAISRGLIDAVVVKGPEGPHISALAAPNDAAAANPGALRRSQEAEAAEAFARAIVEQATSAVVVCGADAAITRASLAAEHLLGAPLAGRRLTDALPMEVVPPAPAAGAPLAMAHLAGMRMSTAQVFERVLLNHRLHGAEVQVLLPPLRDRHFLLDAGPLTHPGGHLAGCILTLTEITERKRTETRQNMLVAELNHRVKNILAIVQSVAWQTLSANHSPTDFKEAFDGRLRALSLAHDILTHGCGQVELEDLVERSLGPYYGAANGPHVEWSGGHVLLPPNMVVPLSMVLHELATNAAKYGAFSRPQGRVRIAWETAAGGEVRVTWVETGGPSVEDEPKAGFGSKLITRVVSYDLSGRAELAFPPDGFRCTLTFPFPRGGAEAQRPLSAAQASPVH